MDLKRGNKGQVTIFIIVGILVVAIFVLIFVLVNRESKPENSVSTSGVFSPEDFMTSCIEEIVEKNIYDLSHVEGLIESGLSIDFEKDGEIFNVPYLCYTSDYESPCVVQEASIIDSLEKNLYSLIYDDVEVCFNNLVNNYENEGFYVDSNYEDFVVDLISGQIILNIASGLSVSKGESVSFVEEIIISLDTDLFDLGKIIQRIIKEESEAGSFDRLSYLLFHPGYNIEREKTGNSKIYFVESEDTKELLVFAVRGGI